MKHALKRVEFIHAVNVNNTLLVRAEAKDGAVRVTYDDEKGTVFVDQKDKDDVLVPLANIKAMTLKSSTPWTPEKPKYEPHLEIDKKAFLEAAGVDIGDDIPKAAGAPKKSRAKRQ